MLLSRLIGRRFGPSSSCANTPSSSIFGSFVTNNTIKAYKSTMTSASTVPLLVKANQLRDEYKSARILDATWFMPNANRDPLAEFKQEHIPGAQFWPVDEVADHTHPLKLHHMMPDARTFADACALRGIKNDDHVVVYDTHGVFSAPRTLFTFKSFGHQNVSVLDGGLPSWKSFGYPTESGDAPKLEKSEYTTPNLDSTRIKSYEDIVANANKAGPEQDPSADYVLDARPNGRFTGADNEPRPQLSSGHIPNSLSLPFMKLLGQVDGANYKTYLPTRELERVLIESLGSKEALEKVLNSQQGLTFSCGSGMTAAILMLAVQLVAESRKVGLPSKLAIYDESWTGYADPSRNSKIIKD